MLLYFLDKETIGQFRCGTGRQANRRVRFVLYDLNQPFAGAIAERIVVVAVLYALHLSVILLTRGARIVAPRSVYKMPSAEETIESTKVTPINRTGCAFFTRSR